MLKVRYWVSNGARPASPFGPWKQMVKFNFGSQVLVPVPRHPLLLLGPPREEKCHADVE